MEIRIPVVRRRGRRGQVGADIRTDRPEKTPVACTRVVGPGHAPGKPPRMRREPTHPEEADVRTSPRLEGSADEATLALCAAQGVNAAYYDTCENVLDTCLCHSDPSALAKLLEAAADLLEEEVCSMR